MKLWQTGLLTIIISGLVNAVLIQNEIGGVLRELMRLTVLAGFALLVVGIFKALGKKFTAK